MTSENSKDSISILNSHYKIKKKSHKVFFQIKLIDSAIEHINLIHKLCNYLKENDIKWVEIRVNFSPIIPQNTIYTFSNKNIVCHIEDFKKFYFQNVSKFIELRHVYYHAQLNVDGWTLISDSKKEKRNKYNILLNDLKELTINWNSLDD